MGVTKGGQSPRDVRPRFGLKGDAVFIDGVEVSRNFRKILSVSGTWRLEEHTISSYARPLYCYISGCHGQDGRNCRRRSLGTDKVVFPSH